MGRSGHDTQEDYEAEEEIEMADSYRAGKVRKLLKSMFAPEAGDTGYKLPGTDEARAADYKRRSEDTTNYTLPPALGTPEGDAYDAKQAAKRAAQKTKDDGLLLPQASDAPAPKPKKKKKPAKSATGTDTPVDVNGEY